MVWGATTTKTHGGVDLGVELNGHPSRECHTKHLNERTGNASTANIVSKLILNEKETGLGRNMHVQRRTRRTKCTHKSTGSYSNTGDFDETGKNIYCADVKNEVSHKKIYFLKFSL